MAVRRDDRGVLTSSTTLCYNASPLCPLTHDGGQAPTGQIKQSATGTDANAYSADGCRRKEIELRENQLQPREEQWPEELPETRHGARDKLTAWISCNQCIRLKSNKKRLSANEALSFHRGSTPHSSLLLHTVHLHHVTLSNIYILIASILVYSVTPKINNFWVVRNHIFKL